MTVTATGNARFLASRVCDIVSQVCVSAAHVRDASRIERVAIAIEDLTGMVGARKTNGKSMIVTALNFTSAKTENFLWKSAKKISISTPVVRDAGCRAMPIADTVVHRKTNRISIYHAINSVADGEVKKSLSYLDTKIVKRHMS
jgi:hypothetical protein